MMLRNDKLFMFDFPFDRPQLLSVLRAHEQDFEVYEDVKHGTNDYFLKLKMTFDYADQINDYFGFNGSPRFYKLLKNRDLEFHQDFGTTCSLNVILSGDDAAPITFEDDMTTYYYSQCILNTQMTHGVFNNHQERLLFKMSFFDVTYESVCDKVAAKLAQSNN